MVSGFNTPNYMNYARTALQNNGTQQLLRYAGMTRAKDVADYLSGADQIQDETFGTSVVAGTALMTSPWMIRAMRHPLATFGAFKPTNAVFKAIPNMSAIPKAQLGKAAAEIYKANRLMLLGETALAGAAKPGVAKVAIEKSIGQLQAALRSGNPAKIAECTGALEGLVGAAKKPGVWKKVTSGFKGVQPATATELLNASKTGGTAAKAAYTTAAAKASESLTMGAKFKNCLKTGGAVPMAIFEGAFEAVEVYKTADQLGAGAAIRQTAKSTAKVAASVGGWIGGAKGGAALGTAIGTAICPGIGTAIGAGLGFLIGGFAGSWAAKKVAKAVVGEDELAKAKKEQSRQIVSELNKNPNNLAEAEQLIAQKIQTEGQTEGAAKAVEALTKMAETMPPQLTQTQVTDPQANTPLTMQNPNMPNMPNMMDPNFAMMLNDPNFYSKLAAMPDVSTMSALGIPGMNGLNGSYTLPNMNNQYQSMTQSQLQTSPKLDLNV